jgi:hypothetical protein
MCPKLNAPPIKALFMEGHYLRVHRLVFVAKIMPIDWEAGNREGWKAVML